MSAERGQGTQAVGKFREVHLGGLAFLTQLGGQLEMGSPFLFPRGLESREEPSLRPQLVSPTLCSPSTGASRALPPFLPLPGELGGPLSSRGKDTRAVSRTHCSWSGCRPTSLPSCCRQARGSPAPAAACLPSLLFHIYVIRCLSSVSISFKEVLSV